MEKGVYEGTHSPKKNQRSSKGDKFIENNMNNISANNFDLEFDVDPLFEKNSKQFDGADANDLLLTKLYVHYFKK
jgi:Condensin complex subunit 2